MQKKCENVEHLQDRIKLKKPQNPGRLRISPWTGSKQAKVYKFNNNAVFSNALKQMLRVTVGNRSEMAKFREAFWQVYSG
jgi:hypothetical protein